MTVSEETLASLGFRALLELVSGYAQSAEGRAALLALTPQDALEGIRGKRGLYEDMLALQERTVSLPGLPLPESAALMMRVQPEGALLDGEELLVFREILAIGQDVLRFRAQPEVQELPVLSALCARVTASPALYAELVRTLDVDGTILDNATPRLREIRQARTATERRLQRALEGILQDEHYSTILQERFVTTRGGRYVIPVRRDARAQLPGLVHDVSSTGQTLFVEPTATLGLGNDLSTLAAEEREEVRRILAELSAGVRDALPELRADVKVIAELDAAAAVARWAVDYGCHLPAFGGQLTLKGARHPLLCAQFRAENPPRRPVPLELEMPMGTRVLAITGSNAGGKTVALKTIGLLSLAAQCGLPVPAEEGSLFQIFDYIASDIGDGQSISENLSTFSAHAANMATILKTLPGHSHSLVLLDELGSGTDPAEGGALACAVLGAVVRQNALTVATTHLEAVKDFVHAGHAMVNASVRFNPDTLEPEYSLEVGRPGASHALQIAARMGFPKAVLDHARTFLTGGQLHLEELLRQLEGERRELQRRNSQAQAALTAAEEKRRQVEETQAELKKTRKQLMGDAYARAEAMVANARRDLENLLRTFREKAGKATEAEAVRQAAATARQALEAKERQVAAGAASSALKPAVKPLKTNQLEPGRRIWVERLGAHGRIISADTRHKTLQVEVNGVPFSLKNTEVFPEQAPPSPEEERPPTVSVSIPRFEGQTSHELNLVGMRVDEALPQLENFLNHCIMAHIWEVRIVHGFGTGRLRTGIHAWLKQQRCVENFRLGVDQRDSGGAGVTLVTLRG